MSNGESSLDHNDQARLVAALEHGFSDEDMAADGARDEHLATATDGKPTGADTRSSIASLLSSHDAWLGKGLLDAIRALVRAELRAALPYAAPPEYYSTAVGGVLPPGRNRRSFTRFAPQIPGAVRHGGRRGRSVVWTVSRADYESWLYRTPRGAGGFGSTGV